MQPVTEILSVENMYILILLSLLINTKIYNHAEQIKENKTLRLSSWVES